MSTGDDPVVDAVIAVRNGARFLKVCLDSVMAQTRAPRAVIVVDDGSSCATPQLLFGRPSVGLAVLDTISSRDRLTP
jgi:GT2 family glycosyltransferase